MNLDSKEALELQARKVPKAHEESQVIRVHLVNLAHLEHRVREAS